MPLLRKGQQKLNEERIKKPMFDYKKGKADKQLRWYEYLSVLRKKQEQYDRGENKTYSTARYEYWPLRRMKESRGAKDARAYDSIQLSKEAHKVTTEQKDGPLPKLPKAPPTKARQIGLPTPYKKELWRTKDERKGLPSVYGGPTMIGIKRKDLQTRRTLNVSLQLT